MTNEAKMNRIKELRKKTNILIADIKSNIYQPIIDQSDLPLSSNYKLIIEYAVVQDGQEPTPNTGGIIMINDPSEYHKVMDSIKIIRNDNLNTIGERIIEIRDELKSLNDSLYDSL